MAEVVISIAAKVSEYLVDPVIRGGYYLFCVSRLIKSLENEKRKLTSIRDDVSLHAKEAEKKTERIEDAVKKWLQEVQSLLEEVENMEQEVRVNNCLWGLCPTRRRYCLCRQLAKKIERMIELHNNSKFEKFSHLASLPTIEYFSSGHFTLFESTKLAYDQLLEALRDNNCYMISLYGTGGCGKTTLSKEVGKRAKELNLFDKVVFTTVSQTPDVRSIQDEIADLLSLKFGEQSIAGRARRLSLRLQSGERILVILDDVWAKLNLEDIGIPLDGNLKGCKVLLTTRLQQLCTMMDCQRNVLLGLLSEEEAWVLFQKKAHIADESSSMLLNKVAQEVAMECKRLPIAIEAVGTSLKGKSLHEWKVALDKLRHSKPLDVEEGVRDVFTCLQYSYDHLKSEEAKGLFLMCCIFPEDHEIYVEDLFRYAIGLGLCGEADSFDTSRSIVNNGLNHLVDSSLLMHSEKFKNHFIMHDMIRDVALWMSSKLNRTIMVDHAKGLNSLALNGAIENCCAVSTWYKVEDQFVQQLNAPKLEILLLNSYSSMDLSYASFEGITGLKVMAIILTSLCNVPMKGLLPQSIQRLTNLRTLRLRGCDLGDISFVVSLKKLEILDFRGSRFKVLPNGIEELNKLKLLDLSNCIIDDCCDEVIGRCSQLEELYAYSSESYEGSTIIYSYKCFQENASFPKLQSYLLQIGQFQIDIEHCMKLWHPSMRVLFLRELNIYTSSPIIKDLLQRAEAVGLDNLLGGFKSVFPELVKAIGSMNQLTKLGLHSCSDIEFLISTTPTHAYCFQEDDVYPMLVELKLHNMDNLKQVCHGPPPLCIFQKLENVIIGYCRQLQSLFLGECNFCNLKYLSIWNCPKLTSLFSMSVTQTLLHLEIIKVEACSGLQHIIMNEGKNGIDTGTEIFPVSEISSTLFPKLRYLMVNLCDKLQSLLPISFDQGPVPLQEIRIRNVSELKRVFGKHEELGIPTYQQMKCIFLRDWNMSNLKNLVIEDFPKLTSLFSVSVAQTLLLLEELTVKCCRELKYIIFNEEESDSATRKRQFPVSHNSPLKFPKLTYLRVEDCDKLEYILPISYAQGLVQLYEIHIRNAPRMKHVFGNHASEDLSTNGNHIQIVFPQLKDFQLINLPSLIEICLGNYHPTWPSLERLEWYNCPKLTTLCGDINVGLELTQPHPNKELQSHVANDGQVCNEDSNLQAASNAIKQLSIDEAKEKILLTSSVKHLHLKHSPELMFIWISFQNIYYLNLSKCRRLKSIFSATVIRSLGQLTYLLIRDCDKLEEIISDPDFEQQPFGNPSSSTHLQRVCFPNLTFLLVERCSKLKCLFSVTRKRASNETRDVEVIEFLFPLLRDFSLENLPSLIDICGGFQFQFRLQLQVLESWEVKDCPNFSSTTTATINNLIHARRSHKAGYETQEEEEEKEDADVKEEGEKDYTKKEGEEDNTEKEGEKDDEED